MKNLFTFIVRNPLLPNGALALGHAVRRAGNPYRVSRSTVWVVCEHPGMFIHLPGDLADRCTGGDNYDRITVLLCHDRD